MKTLAIITIVFLPGALVATVFSIGMFEFRDKRQQIWIYFVVVVPFTIFVMAAWLMWLENTPFTHPRRVSDVESGRNPLDGTLDGNNANVRSKGGKGKKQE